MPKYVVRYGSMRHLGVMSARSETLRRGERVVVRTQRGVEIGDVLCEASDDALTHLDDSPQGQILRLLSEEDASEAGRIEERRNDVFQSCRARIVESGLPMKLIDVEQMLGGDRIVVYYLSDDRVDFRDLVKALATDLRTRIEMRQVGVRDEAKLLADYGDCGKPVCCNTHLSQMPPVSMKMAKLQKATLDPNKISGRCGRLKCCLRYEYDTYEAIVKELPPVGSEIVTRDGKGRVIGLEILAEQLLIETEDHRRRTIHSSEVLTVVRRGSNRPGRGGGGGGAGPRGRQPERGAETEERNDSRDESLPVAAPPRGDAAGETKKGRGPAETASPLTTAEEASAAPAVTAAPAETAGARLPSETPLDPQPRRDASIPAASLDAPIDPPAGDSVEDLAEGDEEFVEGVESEAAEGETAEKRSRRGGRRRRGRRRSAGDDGPAGDPPSVEPS